MGIYQINISSILKNKKKFRLKGNIIINYRNYFVFIILIIENRNLKNKLNNISNIPDIPYFFKRTISINFFRQNFSTKFFLFDDRDDNSNITDNKNIINVSYSYPNLVSLF